MIWIQEEDFGKHCFEIVSRFKFKLDENVELFAIETSEKEFRRVTGNDEMLIFTEKDMEVSSD